LKLDPSLRAEALEEEDLEGIWHSTATAVRLFL
jgi:hypothetical protein